MTKGPKLAEIATRIHAHLKRFEADPKINRYKDADRHQRGLHPFYWSGAYVGGSRVGVRYISYQGATCLTKQEALGYLAWLDAGNVGKHNDMKGRK